MSHHLKLSDAQQYFLQIMLNKGVIDQNSFKNIFCGVLNKFEIPFNETQLKHFYVSFLREINDAIKNFSMEIRSGVCEITGMSFYCLIRQSDSSGIGKMSSLYSPVELKLFKKILALIIESDEGYVDFNYILNQIVEDNETLSQTNKLPTNKEIRLSIEKFIQDNWLIEVFNKPNMITLHGRAMIELSQYMTEVFDNEVLNKCSLCKSLLLNGVSCNSCSIKLHRHCSRKFFEKQKTCPNCKKEFTDEQIKELRESINSAKSAYTQSQASSQI